MNLKTKHAFLVMLGLVACVLPARAQWVTQTNTLKAGWNAIYLHVDASHTTLADLIGSDTNNPISDVWVWNPAPSSMQYSSDPNQIVMDSSQWSSWSRTNSDASLLQSLVGNAAYLVCVYSNAPQLPYTWKIKGRPLPPAHDWTTAGINFIGFPTVPAGAPTLYDFLAKCPDLFNNSQVYQYTGGDMGANNPAAVTVYAWRATPVRRDQAFWFCKTNYFNTYFGPFDIDLSSKKSISYGDTLSVQSFRLRNHTASNLTVTLRLAASETPPVGQTNITCVPPLLVRGSVNATNLSYGFSNLTLSTACSWKLAPQGAVGSEVQVVLGLNRSAMTGQVGDFQAGILGFTDSFGYTKVEVPVSANVASSAGLWVGNAAITQVGEYLKAYAQGTNGAPAVDINGAYIVTNTTTRLGSVASTYPLRLIVHNPAAGGPAVLLQHVFCGVNASSNAVVATTEGALNPDFLKAARRISAAHLPWSAANAGWTFSGNLDQTNITVRVTTGYDDQASNPFVHTYHPDHDNLDATFKTKLPQGVESYTIQRDITLTTVPPVGDFDSYVSKSKTISGTYSETITVLGMARSGGPDQRVFTVRGVFSLNRITDVSALTVLAP